MAGRSRTSRKISRAYRDEPTIGRADLPENSPKPWTVMRLKRPERSRSEPVSPTETEFAPKSIIERRLMRAMQTIRAMPDKERRILAVKGASVPYLQEYIDAYASSDIRVPIFVPTPADVSDCLTALSWVRHADRKLWKIMWLRSFGFSFGLIAKYIGRSDETARRLYREGITDAWATANGL